MPGQILLHKKNGVYIEANATNPLPVDATISALPLPSGAASAANQTNGAQQTQITDGANVAAVIAGSNTGVKGLRVYGGPTDPISDIPVMLDYSHHQNHEGESYQWLFFGAVNAGTKDVRISVPNLTATTRTPHVLFEVISDNTTATISLYEGTTWTAAGQDDSANIRNRNRNSANTPGTKIYVSGAPALTPNALGTLLSVSYLFTSKASINIDQVLSEWILKTSTEYLFRVVTVGNGTVLIRVHFYEDLGV